MKVINKHTLSHILALVLFISVSVFSSENMGDFIFHHIGNSPSWHPFPGISIPLPAHFMVGNINLGITLHVLMILLAATLMMLLLSRAAKRKNHIPQGLFSHAIEATVIYIRDELVYPNLGKKDGAHWLPFFLTLFFFILTLNIIGLVPGFATATANINFTAALAIVIFITFNLSGIMHNGLGHYFVNLVPKGIPWPVLLILAPIEVLGLFTKPFALAIRLFANMSAGHIIILSLLSLISILKSSFPLDGIVVGGSIVFALFIYCIEILVAFLQAYVFTLLSSLYIGMAIHQEH